MTRKGWKKERREGKRERIASQVRDRSRELLFVYLELQLNAVSLKYKDRSEKTRIGA